MPQCTLNVQLMQHTPDPEKLVAMSARTCYAASTLDDLRKKITAEEQQVFLRNLIASGHLSTLEHASFTFGVEGVSRTLLAQLTRHRIASFSVQSQRYVSMKQPFEYVIPPSIEALGSDAVDEYAAQMAQMHSWYQGWQNRLGNRGEQANQDARFVLPGACATRLMMTMNARELLHFFALRCCERAQWEIRSMACEMLRQVYLVAPSLFATAGPGCLQDNCPEGSRSCKQAAQVQQKFSMIKRRG